MLNATRSPAMTALAGQAEQELQHNILPFWTKFADWDRFGFYGASDTADDPVKDAPKGCVLNSRVLYTFARAHRQLGDPNHKALAEHALHALTQHFYLPDSATLAWMLDANGRVMDDDNHLYNTSFALYAVTEWVRASADPGALDFALSLFLRIEQYCRDDAHGGYLEAFDAHWQPVSNDKVCDTEAGVVTAKSLNTHLHLMEAYTNLARVAPDCGVQAPLTALINLIMDRPISSDGPWFDLFFHADWTPASASRSFGHDIECSWLLCDAVSVLSHPHELSDRANNLARQIVDATIRDGLADDGSLLNERRPDGSLDTDRIWWVQTEALVGFVNLWQRTGHAAYADIATNLWQYLQYYLIDGQREWHWKVDAQGLPGGEPKVNPWKCPYHNGRGCLELMARLAG